MKTITIAEGARLGVSYLARTANEGDCVVLTKNNDPVALVLPITVIGLQRFIDSFEEEVNNDPDVPKEIMQMLKLYKKLFNKSR